MSCFDFPSARIQCEPHHVRVNNDIKKLTQISGYDFDKFRDVLSKSPNYCIEWFPCLIGEMKYIQFDTVIRTDSYRGKIYVITSRKNIRLITHEYYNDSVNRWHIEGEKNELREKLKAVGIIPEW